MALVVFAIMVLLAMAGHSSGGGGGTWCVCKNGVSEKELQTTIDYACGAGADCGPIHQKGACYEPNTVMAHCSYAANSYFQRKGQGAGTCDFAGAASITTTDPSSNGCVYPSSPSSAAAATTTTTPTPPTSTTPSTNTPSTSTATPTTTGSPYTSTPVGITGGTAGVSNNGFDTGIPDESGLRPSRIASISFLTAFLALALMLC